MKAWKVTAPNGAPIFHNGIRLITTDTVFFDDDCDAEYVRESLINHDGYFCNIRVQREK